MIHAVKQRRCYEGKWRLHTAMFRVYERMYSPHKSAALTRGRTVHVPDIDTFLQVDHMEEMLESKRRVLREVQFDPVCSGCKLHHVFTVAKYDESINEKFLGCM